MRARLVELWFRLFAVAAAVLLAWLLAGCASFDAPRARAALWHAMNPNAAPGSSPYKPFYVAPAPGGAP